MLAVALGAVAAVGLAAGPAGADRSSRAQSRAATVVRPAVRAAAADSYYCQFDRRAGFRAGALDVRADDPTRDPNQPTANADSYSTPLNTSVTGNVRDNDTGTIASSCLLDDPSNGAVTFTIDGTFTYEPTTGFVGPDRFTYLDQGPEGETSDVGVVTIDVQPPRPTANDDTYSVTQNGVLTRSGPTGVLANDESADGDPLSAERVKGSTTHHGQLTVETDGGFVYTPDPGYVGPDSFQYRAYDIRADRRVYSNVATVRITVTATVTPATSTPPAPISTPPAGPTTPVTTSPVAPPTSDVPGPPAGTPPAGSTPTHTPTVGAPTGTPTPPSTPVPPPSSTSGTRSLRLTALSVNPGGDLRAKGSGCAPNDAIQLTVAGQPAGKGTADSSGGFDIPVTTTGLDIGSHTVTAVCGGKQLVAQVALVSTTSNTNAPTAQALVVAAALAFFLLLLGLILRRPTS